MVSSILPLCQNNNDITRTALFIKKLQIENSNNWMKIEELVSSGCLKKLLKNRIQQENLRRLYEFLQITKILSSP